MLILKNPHSVLAVLKNRPKDLKKLVLPEEKTLSDGWELVLQEAKKNQIRIHSPQSVKASDRSPDRSHDRSQDRGAGRFGLCEAEVLEKQPVELSSLFESVSEDKPGLWLALDCIQDPQNLGALFRLAGFFGVRGILMTQDRSAALTSTVYDVASGGVECVPFAQEVNLSRAFEEVKEAGLWILGTSEHETNSLFKQKFDRNWMICVGNEEKGLRRLTLDRCDVTVGIPAFGPIPSLNVATAAATALTYFVQQKA